MQCLQRNLKFISIILFFVFTTSISAFAGKLEVESLYGKSHSELKRVFPTLSGSEVENWDSWETVYLTFNENGHLASISFIPMQPLSEKEAKRIVKEDFELELPSSNEVRVPAGVMYRNMVGKVRTVNFHTVDLRKNDCRIEEIGIYFNIDWNE